MKLFETLQKVTSEEDVKDVYIKALGLKGYRKNLIDIQTEEIWFEAKPNAKLSSYAMFTQLLHYIQKALDMGDHIPPFLAVIDTRKAAIMKTVDALPLLERKTIKWGKSASQYTQEALETVSAYIGAYIVSFNIETHEDEFISTVKNAIKHGYIIRTQITPANLKQVFDKWVEMIGKEIEGVVEEDYSLLFFADIMHDGSVSTHKNLPAELLHKDNSPVFSLNGKNYELNNKEGYRRFWSIYHKPPKSEYRDYLLERRDSLIPLDERSYKGAYYTPLAVVDKAYDKLNEVLGENWQEEYIVWDMCCGVGNLEVKHSNHRNIFMSTLDSEDIDVMKATKTCVSATKFQYDYLNDDINDNGLIDYSLTNKIPINLRKAIKSNKKILVLINPPYAESGKGLGKGNKSSVSKTKFSKSSMRNYGKSTNELFTQFIVRISNEIPNATLAIFSKLKYVNSPNFEVFRQNWNATFKDGFIVHSKLFDGLKGDFPIGFLIWEIKQNYKIKNPINDISLDILNKEVTPIGEKMLYNIPSNSFLSNWIDRPRANNVDMVPLSNAVTPSKVKSGSTKWSHNAIAHFVCDSNDLQNSSRYTLILSSSQGIGHKGSIYVTSKNIWQVSIVFSVRRLIKHTWINDRDQFLKPTGELTEEFKNDCLVWMLFNVSNLTASANDLEWNGKKWSIVNHFIPFTEEEVNAPDRFESDFLVSYMQGKIFSCEAHKVLDEGRNIWKSYFEHTDSHSVRELYKLNRPDVGWYQIRKAIQARNESGDYLPVSFASFEQEYASLTEKLRPMVYDLGFLMKN